MPRPAFSRAPQPPAIRVNHRIRAREVRVINGATSEQLGVLKLPDALRKAEELGLDLVEVAPNANPPVCRIVNFGKYRYELAKQDKDKKSTAGKVKEVKFRVNIDSHDYLTKLRHAEEFLDKGNKLKVQLQFRGRQMAHQELGMAVVLRVKEDLATMGHVDMEPKLVGRSINMVMSPLPANKRKRKFKPMEFEPEDDSALPDESDETED
jgi:translation initiation factor IF-3